MGEEVVLHGDLHHENILSSDRGWVAIDPKGMIGEREYETGALIRNPVLHDTRTLADGEDPSHWLAVADRLEPLTGR